MNSKKVEKTSEVGEGMLYVFFCKLLFVSGPHGSVMPIIFHQRIIICLMIVRYYLNLFVKMTVEYFCTFLLLSEVGYQSSLQQCCFFGRRRWYGGPDVYSQGIVPNY